MPFSALVDLVGVRELAVDDPSAYVLHSLNFRTFLERVFSGQTGSRVYFFRDHCYVQEETPETLITILQVLRRELLLHAELHIRAAVTVGDIGADRIHFSGAADIVRHASKRIKASRVQPPVGDQAIISGYAFNDRAAKLFGDLETLKGIGISLDNESARINPDIQQLTMENFFITEGRAHRYHAFSDLRLEEAVIAPSTLTALIRNFRQSRAASRKVARFFVPALINWARNMSLARGTEPTLDADIVYGRLGAFRDVTGIELVYLTLIDRIYGEEAKTFDTARVAALKGYFLKAKSIHALLRTHDYNTVPIPKSILSQSSRRAFITDVAKVEKREHDVEGAVDTA